MGIPGFYRWLVEKYPDTLCRVVQSRKVDLTAPNRNGVEFDNLYIDMNGIIHPCFHPEGLPAASTYEDVFRAMFRYIKTVFSIVRPRKLLFLALDGVAPRAKMNHQRIRRFRASKEAGHEFSAEGEGISKSKADKNLDSNVITPGTEFMALLSSVLNHYVQWMMNVDPAWRNIKVILSDSSVAGEGEYKILSYIRSQRNLQGYDPNTRHCLHGLDADLIMLALATHEIHFTILREMPEKTRGVKARRNVKVKQKSMKMKTHRWYMTEFINDLEFEFFNIWVLREYLERELLPDVKEKDLERLIDDFVFMCLFAGNDFLPHLPSVDISKGGIELLMTVYQQEFNKMGYLTDSSKVNLKHMEHFVQALSSHEKATYMQRYQVRVKKKKGKWVKRKKFTQDSFSNNGQPGVLDNQSTSGVKSDDADSTIDEVGEKKKEKWKKRKISQDSLSNNGQPGVLDNQSISGVKSGDADSTIDEVKRVETNAKRRYYTEKFDAVTDSDCDRIQRDAVFKYTEGICWVMHYYYQEVCSWQWFYPYHYAPLASDFHALEELEVDFTLGQPFKPLDQLLAVLPAASAQALPLSYRELMINPSSPILDFYPKDAKIEKNGKKHAWQGVCKLPFIEESRLLSEIAKVEHTLTDKEKQRNSLGRDRLFVHFRHPLAGKIKNHPQSDPSLEVQIEIDPELSGGMNGYICISGATVWPLLLRYSPFHVKRISKQNEVISVYYKYPSFHAHVSKLSDGVIMPPRILGHQVSPHPPVISHVTPVPLLSSIPERPVKKMKIEQKKPYEVQKSCMDKKKAPDEVQKSCMDKKKAPEIREQKKPDEVQKSCMDKKKAPEIREHCAGPELGTALKQHGSMDVVRESNINNEASNGKQESVLGAEPHLMVRAEKVYRASQHSINVEVGEKLTNMVETDFPFAKEQEIMGGDKEHSITDGPKGNNRGKSSKAPGDGSNAYKTSTIGKMSDAIENLAEVHTRSVDVKVSERVTNRTECDSQSNTKIEILGGGKEFDTIDEPRRKHKKKRVKGEKLAHSAKGEDAVDVCEKPTNRGRSDSLLSKEQEMKGDELDLVEGKEKIEILDRGNEFDTGDEPRRKHKKKRVKGERLEHSAKGEDAVDVCEKPTNRVRSDSSFSKEQQINVEKVDLVEGKEKIHKTSQNTMSAEAKGDMLGTEMYLDKANGASRDAEVSEKARNRLESDTGGENESRKKQKKRKHSKEAVKSGEKEEINGAIQNNNDVEEASEKPTYGLEPDVPSAKEQANPCGEREGEPKRKKKRAKVNTNTDGATVAVEEGCALVRN